MKSGPHAWKAHLSVKKTYHIIGRKREGVRAGDVDTIVRQSNSHDRIRDVDVLINEEHVDEAPSACYRFQGDHVVPQNLARHQQRRRVDYQRPWQPSSKHSIYFAAQEWHQQTTLMSCSRTVGIALSRTGGRSVDVPSQPTSGFHLCHGEQSRVFWLTLTSYGEILLFT